MSQNITEEQRITLCKTAAGQIHTMLQTAPQDWRNSLGLVRTMIAHLDVTNFMQQPSRTDEQAWVLAALQKLASMDADNGAVLDIAAWCTRHWLEIHQRDSHNVAALRGIGQAWLMRARPALARINRADSYSQTNHSSTGSYGAPSSTTDEDDPYQLSAAEAEQRVGSPDYVEARGLLQPATEYLERAVAAAATRQAISGDLLTVTAEAYISLGNVSCPRTSEQPFRRALQLLRAASMISGYRLSAHLQQYLDAYGRLLD